MISWPYRPGFLQDTAPTEIPSTAPERLKLMRRIARDWAEPFRSVVLDIPEETEPKNVRLEDWLPGTWDNRGGRVTLVGDAAHAMVMCRFSPFSCFLRDDVRCCIVVQHQLNGVRDEDRGEAANHGFMDVKVLLDNLLPFVDESGVNTQGGLVAAMDSYEVEVRKRCRPAVLASRQACLDANEYRRIDERSPLVVRRVMSFEDE